MAGLPPPPLAPLGKTTGLGRVAGGRSSRKEGTDEEREEAASEGEVAEGSGLRGCALAGRKDEGTSLAEEALRWSGWLWWEGPPSPSRSRREWSGLDGSEAPPPPPPPPPLTPFSCSSVSSTTSGACVCLEALMAVSMSCRRAAGGNETLFMVEFVQIKKEGND